MAVSTYSPGSSPVTVCVAEETVGIGCPKLQRALAVGGVATVFGDGRTGAGNGPVLIVLSVLEAAVRYVILGQEWR